MNLAIQMHQNIKRSNKVPEAMLRNLITTVDGTIKANDLDKATLLNRCIELQVMYFIDNRTIRALESKNDPMRIKVEEYSNDLVQFIWEEIEKCLYSIQLNIGNEVKDILYRVFESQKSAAHHIIDGLACMDELAKTVQEFKLDLPAPVNFKSRFKTYRSFLVKMLQKYEKNDILDLMSYHDFLAFKLTLMTFSGQEKQAILDAYSLFNDTIRLMLSMSYQPVPLKSVGEPDSRVAKMWAPLVKDYIKNPKMRFDVIHDDTGNAIECYSKPEVQNVIRKYPGKGVKIKRIKLYQGLHAAFAKDGNDIEGQVTTDDMSKANRSHDNFKQASRGALNALFNVSEYRLEGVKIGPELNDFYYFIKPKFIHDITLRP